MQWRHQATESETAAHTCTTRKCVSFLTDDSENQITTVSCIPITFTSQLAVSGTRARRSGCSRRQVRHETPPVGPALCAEQLLPWCSTATPSVVTITQVPYSRGPGLHSRPCLWTTLVSFSTSKKTPNTAYFSTNSPQLIPFLVIIETIRNLIRPGTLAVRGEFRPRQTRQLPRAVDLKGRLLSCQSY